MKKIVFLLFLGAAGLLGCAFFGLYTAPGLEKVPTFESLVAARSQKAKPQAKSQANPDQRPKGYYKANKNGAVNQRNQYLKSQKGKVTGSQ